MRLARFLRRIRCGHTYANFFNQPTPVQAELFEGRNKVPFTFEWIGTAMVVTSNDVLPRGTEVLGINEVPSSRVLRELMALARADGGNDAKRRNHLAVTGRDGYEAFNVYHPLVFPLTKPEFRLRVRRPGQRKDESVVLPAFDLAQRNATRVGTVAPARDEKMWEDRRIGPDVACLRMPSWALYDSTWNWRGYLASFFDGLVSERVANLILDLRENEGGNDVGREILARLTPKPIAPEPFDRIVRYRKVPADLLPCLSTWDRGFEDWGSSATAIGPGRYRLSRPGVEDEATIVPAGRRYEGRVFVLMGATNSSATFQFVSEIKRTGLATLVGQTSGGNRRGINGGAFFFLTMPRTKIEVDVPLIGDFPAGSPPDAGIAPDVRVARTVASIARGEDAELAAALRFCR